MNESTNGSGYSNGNGNGNGKLPTAVLSYIGNMVPSVLTSIVAAAALWGNLSGGIHKEIASVKDELAKNMDRIEKTFDDRARQILDNRNDITRLQESDIENEVQHAHRGVMTNMEAMVDEMRDFYRGQCPNCKSYERHYYPPQRLGKELDK